MSFGSGSILLISPLVVTATANNISGFRYTDPLTPLIKKTGNKNEPSKWSEINGYYYKFVITNDEEITSQKLIEEYHQRGNSEKVFDELKNDFGWRILPFSKMNENFPYLQMTAWTSIVYQGLIQMFGKVIEKIKPTIRLEKFRNLFIKVMFSMVNNIPLFYDADLDFQKIA